MSDASKAIITTSITAGVTLIVAILSLLAAHASSQRERRRGLYSEAVRAAVSWKEMLYRVRRRQEGDVRDLIKKFHDQQDQLTYYQAWIGSESRAVKQSYDRLVREVKARTEPLVTAAWDEEIREAPGNARPDDQHPDLSDLVDNFLADVRSHLSPWPWRKCAVRWRNRRH